MKRYNKGKIALLFFLSALLHVRGVSILKTAHSDETNLNDVKISEECDCGPYGLCEFDGGLKKCTCTSSTAEFNGKCIECDCGEYSTNCSFSTNGNKICDCKPKYIDLGGNCTECDCGDDGSCNIESTTKKCVCRPNYIEVNGKCQACECGPATYSCFLDSSGNKVCTCFRGYKAKHEICTECDCGKKGLCSFENGQKECLCHWDYDVLNGKCEYCGCGENSLPCNFDENGDKKCNCYSRYADNNGTCEECFCGYSGSCSFENGLKQCNCTPPTVDMDGYCYEVPTTKSTTGEISTKLTSSTPAECNEDNCVYGTCEAGENGFKCRCDETFKGERCDEKIQIEPDKNNTLMIVLLSVAFGIFILFAGILCFRTKFLSKLSNRRR